MKVIIAMDSFKGSLTSLEAGNTIKEAICHVFPHSNVTVCKLADGGEGTVSALISEKEDTIINIDVTGPCGNKVMATYGISRGKTAVIEAASSCGLTLVENKKRNPMNTTTFGMGEMINDAINRGCRNFIIGLGGSSTNDGGLGMLRALGIEFFDENNHSVGVTGKNLLDVKKICTDKMNPLLKECHFTVGCDVSNPLLGESGASAVFAPQKGADRKTVEVMEKAMENYSALLEKAFNRKTADFPGAGAAGGLGFAFLTCFDAELKSGIDIVLQRNNLEELISDADIVVTGEGKIDAQTKMGKAPLGVAVLAKKHNRKVIAFCGCTDGNDCSNNEDIDAVFVIQSGPCSLAEAMKKENAQKNLKRTAIQVFNLIRSLQEIKK